jgi:hypothetical protein
MKKLTNDPSRNVNAVSGMWVRLRKMARNMMFGM